MCAPRPTANNPSKDDPAKNWKIATASFGVCSLALLASTIVLATRQDGTTKSTGLGRPNPEHVWTKAGSEAIPFDSWRAFSNDEPKKV